jgi:spore coat protein U-like protein
MHCNRPLAVASLLLALAWSISSGSAGAATTTTTFLVTANINAVCTISARTLNFGDYTGVQLSAHGGLTVRCTNTTQWNVGLNEGTAPAATVSSRKMTGPGSSFLDYTIYTDGGASVIWGNTPGTDTVSGTGSGATQFLDVYGVVPGFQLTSAPGGYVDTITATITF